MNDLLQIIAITGNHVEYYGLSDPIRLILVVFVLNFLLYNGDKFSRQPTLLLFMRLTVGY